MLTPLEGRVLRFITQHIARHNHAPTLAEIGTALNVRSRGTVHRYVDSLVEKGYLRRKGRGWRSIRLSGKYNRRMTILPLEGRISDGKPLESIKDQKEINFSDMLMGPDRYALKVRGNSMAEDGILDGDIVLVRKTDSAENGDIVVALIDNNEAVLRRLRKHGNRVEFIPANRKLASMVYPGDRVQIQGIVIGQVRYYGTD